MNNIYVFEEYSLDNVLDSVLFITDNLRDYKSLLNEYYGENKITEFRDIRDSGLEFSFIIEFESLRKNEKALILCRNFILNSL